MRKDTPVTIWAVGGLGRAVVLVVMLSACSTMYRVDCIQPGKSGCQATDGVLSPSLKITSPNATNDDRSQTTTLLVPNVVKMQTRCPWIDSRQTISSLSVQLGPSDRAGNNTLSLNWANEDGEPTSIAELETRRTQVLSAWNRLIDSTEEPWVELKRCLVPNAGEIVRRAIALDWPTGVAQSFGTRLGFEPAHYGRAIALHPGMRVCAVDAKEHADGIRLEPAASAGCADLVNRPGGGTLFDAGLGRISNAFQPPGLETNTINVSSWAEVVDPNAPMNFALINGAMMPRTAPIIPLNYNSTLIVGYSPSSLVESLVALRCGSARHLEIIGDLCEADRTAYGAATSQCVAQVESDPVLGGAKLPENRPFTCFRFPNRTLVRAEFTIFVQKAPVVVTVGTTVGDVVDRYAAPPTAGDTVGLASDQLAGQGEGRRLPIGLELNRRFIDRLVPVNIASAGASVRDLPLQPGDVLTW